MAYDWPMNALFGSLCSCVGVYFAAWSGSVLIRSTGSSGLAATLDRLVVWSPFASILILLLVGFCVTMKEETRESRALMVKLPLVCFAALIPLVVHLVMIKLTFAVEPPSPRLLGPLSLSEWAVLVLGCLLIGF